MDGRIIAQPGSGIATYAAALRRAHDRLTSTPLLLTDDSCYDRTARITGSQRLIRWLRAFTTASVPTSRKTGLAAGSILHAPDIFRLAHVRFRQTQKMLKVEAPGPLGLIHWSLPVPIQISGWINVYTVHDVIPLTHPDLTPMQSNRHRALLEAIAQTADKIVTVTEYSHNAITKNLNCETSLIQNCSIPVVNRIDVKLDLPHSFIVDKYFIFAGSSEPRKNVASLVAAYRESGVSLPLLLIGPHATYSDPGAGIWNLPNQSAQQLASLIAQARALVFPSLAEGFGLPVVEAMALGTAVLTSNEGALAEVAGDAALLVDPRDISSIASGLSMIAGDDGLVRSLERRGRMRAGAFSDENFTKSLSALYGELFSKMIDYA